MVHVLHAGQDMQLMEIIVNLIKYKHKLVILIVLIIVMEFVLGVLEDIITMQNK